MRHGPKQAVRQHPSAGRWPPQNRTIGQPPQSNIKQRRIKVDGRPEAAASPTPRLDFASNTAWSVPNGKAPVRHNTELSILDEAARWRRDVQRYAPERVDEFDRLQRDSLENPKEAHHPDKQKR